MWDRIIATTLRTCVELVDVHPDILITIENPYGMFRMHPSVTALLDRSESSFRLLEVDYCKAADPEFDGDRVFTQKRTDILTYGVRPLPHFDTPRCNRDCRFRFPEESGKAYYHLRAIRIDSKSPIGQTRQLGSMRHAVPCGLFKILFQEHEQWMCSRLDSNTAMVVIPSSVEHAVVGINSLEQSVVPKRKPPTVVETHPQAYSSQLTRMQKLYLLLHF